MADRFGPNGEMNGSDVVVMIETSRGSGTYAVIGSQRGANFGEADSPIDVSSKTTGRPFRGIPGRYTGTLSMSALFIPTASGLGTLRRAIRSGEKLRLRTRATYNNNNDTYTEECDAVITGFNTDTPDQDAAVVSLDVQLDGQWVQV